LISIFSSSITSSTILAFIFAINGGVGGGRFFGGNFYGFAFIGLGFAFIGSGYFFISLGGVIGLGLGGSGLSFLMIY